MLKGGPKGAIWCTATINSLAPRGGGGGGGGGGATIPGWLLFKGGSYRVHTLRSPWCIAGKINGNFSWY